MLALGNTAVSLIARAGFVTTHAGVLALVGPTGQEADIALLAGDFFVFMQTGVSLAAAVSWCEDHEGLKLSLEAVLD